MQVLESGPRPDFNETFVFDVVDHADMLVQVYDYDKYTSDDLVGEVLIDLGSGAFCARVCVYVRVCACARADALLLPRVPPHPRRAVYKYGVRDAVVPLKRPNLWGALHDSGMLYLETDFLAPADLAYPMLQADRDAFDGTLRMNRFDMTVAGRKDDAADADSDRGEASDDEAKAGLKNWSEEDIEAAFRTLDLNRDLFIGREELRHTLVCLGEQVTELEIDEMIDMVDFDGDGQVAFYEFYQLCKEVDPSQPMWKPKAEDSYKERDWFAEGGIRGLDAALDANVGNAQKMLDAKSAIELDKLTRSRSEELRKKREKKTACENAVATIGLRLTELQRAFVRFKKLEAESRRARVPGQLTQEELGKVFDLDADVLRFIYRAFLPTMSDDTVDVRDVLLGLVNFVGCTRPQRINFCFYLFDMDNSGTIDLEEIVLILKGAHLAGSTSYVRKKAETILAAVHSDDAKGDGKQTIDLERFVIAASRFPNVLFPSYEDREPDGRLKKVVLPSLEAQAVQKDLAIMNQRAEKFARDKAEFGSATITIPIPGVDI